MSTDNFPRTLLNAVNDKSVVAVVLAGGASRRMGANKPELIYRGETWLQRVVLAAHGAGLEVIVAGGSGTNLPDGVAFIVDEYPGAGPLPALCGALRAAGGANVILLACDMPLLEATAVQWLLRQAATSAGNLGLVTLRNGRMEPTFSLYCSAALEIIEDMRADEEQSLRALLSRKGFTRVDVPQDIAAMIENVNTPGERDALS